MKRLKSFALAAGIALAMVTTSYGEVSLNSVRVVAKDADGPGDDTTMHVIFTVSDAVATARAAAAAGGTIEREPFAYGDSGMMIGFVIDPEGNHIELIQTASR